jgi:hypothetical protein
MVFSACAAVLALAVSGVPAVPAVSAAPRLSALVPPSSITLDSSPQVIRRLGPASLERWQVDTPPARPAAMPVMYATLGALNALDVYSTRQALGANAREANPVMRAPSSRTAAMVAAKALSMAGTIYFAERAWKKNRAGAIVLMAAINGVTAAVTARNFRNAR